MIYVVHKWEPYSRMLTASVRATFTRNWVKVRARAAVLSIVFLCSVKQHCFVAQQHIAWQSSDRPSLSDA